jgi:hypothetical protein
MIDVITLTFLRFILELCDSFGPSVASPEMQCMEEELGKLENSINNNAVRYDSLMSNVEAVRVELKQQS